MIVDINEQKIEKFVEKLRPPVEVRDQVDIGYSFNANTFLLFEIRPDWKNSDIKNKLEIAKIRFIKSQKLWKLYWFRASGKWELYEPHPFSTSIEELFQVIKDDKRACFWG